MARWLVERPGRTEWVDGVTGTRFEDVGSPSLEVHPSGALIFGTPEDGEAYIVFAPGQWVTVCQEAE